MIGKTTISNEEYLRLKSIEREWQDNSDIDTLVLEVITGYGTVRVEKDKVVDELREKYDKVCIERGAVSFELDRIKDKLPKWVKWLYKIK